MRNKKTAIHAQQKTLEFSLNFPFPRPRSCKTISWFYKRKKPFFHFLFVHPRVALSEYIGPTYPAELPHPSGIFQKKKKIVQNG
jgi:hypothetical protein